MGDAVLYALPLIGLAGGFLSGLLGLGGGVVMLPLLTFVGKVPLKIATGTTLVQVLISALTGMLFHYRAGGVDLKAGLLIGFAGVVGGFAGSFLCVSLSLQSLQLIFIFIVGLSIILLFIPLKIEEKTYTKGDFSKATAILIGLGAGSLAGLLGVGGGFVIIPCMLHILKIPLRVTIGTSLLIILVSSLGTLGAKFRVGHIHLLITLLVISGSVIGALIGARVSQKMPITFLQRILLLLLVLIFVTMIYKTIF